MSARFPDAEDSVRDLESKIGVEPGFFVRLYDEDDRSFIIKLDALLEAACTYLLSLQSDDPASEAVLARLELSGKIVGKTVFLGQHGLVGKEWRQFVAALSEFRNYLVHDVREAGFDLTEFVHSLDPRALEDFAIVFSPHEPILRAQPTDPSRISAAVERATADPKALIWFGAQATLSHIAEIEGSRS